MSILINQLFTNNECISSFVNGLSSISKTNEVQAICSGLKTILNNTDSVKSSLCAIYSNIKSLLNTSTSIPKTIESSNTDVVTAKVGQDTDIGKYDVVVKEVATPTTISATPQASIEEPQKKSLEETIKEMGLRATNCAGVYCQQHNPTKAAGDYSEQVHYVWNETNNEMVEINNVYYISANGLQAKNNNSTKEDGYIQAHVQGYNFTEEDGVFEKNGKNYTFDIDKYSFVEQQISQPTNTTEQVFVESEEKTNNGKSDLAPGHNKYTVENPSDIIPGHVDKNGNNGKSDLAPGHNKDTATNPSDVVPGQNDKIINDVENEINADVIIANNKDFIAGKVTTGTFEIGNATFNITKGTTISNLVEEINSSEASNVNAIWNNNLQSLTLTSRSTGNSPIYIKSGTSNFVEVMGLNGEQNLGKNAEVVINGKNIISTSNTISSDVSNISGLTINVKQKSDSVTELNVKNNFESIANNFSEVVNQCNFIASFVKDSFSGSSKFQDLTNFAEDYVKQYSQDLTKIGISVEDDISFDKTTFIAFCENGNGLESILSKSRENILSTIKNKVESVLDFSTLKMSKSDELAQKYNSLNFICQKMQEQYK